MLQEKPTAVLMLCATILRDRSTVHAKKDTMEMEISAVRVTFLLLYFLSQFLYSISLLDCCDETFVYNNYVYRDIDI